jgi:sugar/nucleoside kinase (ribokinase family)
MDFELENPGILVFGVALIDYIAHVSSFPEPDDKIRTQQAKTSVGGNAANASAGMN